MNYVNIMENSLELMPRFFSDYVNLHLCSVMRTQPFINNADRLGTGVTQLYFEKIFLESLPVQEKTIFKFFGMLEKPIYSHLPIRLEHTEEVLSDLNNFMEKDYINLYDSADVTGLAISFIFIIQYSMEFPMQLRFGTKLERIIFKDLIDLYSSANPQVSTIVKTFDSHGGPKSLAHLRRFVSDITFRKTFFPIKHNNGAHYKVAVFAADILLSKRAESNPRIYNTLNAVMNVMSHLRCAGERDDPIYDDQLTMILLYVIYTDFGKLSYSLIPALMGVIESKKVKEITVVLKSWGLNSNSTFSQLVELETFPGRAVAPPSLEEEARYRCDTEAVRKSVLHFDEGKLSAAISQIIDTELGEVGQLPSLDTYWSKRWQWCKNGSHNQRINHKYGLRMNKLGHTIHRREFMENMEDNPLHDWDGQTFVSVSEKLELGKTRAIFACDTVNYAAFNLFASKLEEAWNNHSVILDPGQLGQVGIAAKIRVANGNFTKYNLMLDYDDFNSQHSTEAMELVWKIVGAKTGWNKHPLFMKCLQSLRKEDVYCKGKYVGRIKGTLLSGHRCTTFFNSVLNKAYLLCSGLSVRIPSLHVGDDVYIPTSDVVTGVNLLRNASKFGCRLNRYKQSFGKFSAEFLRQSIGPSYSIGYLPRAIASGVSGMWENETMSTGLAAVMRMMNVARTIGNRARNFKNYIYLAPSLSRMTRLSNKRCERILSGTISVNGSSVSGETSVIDMVTITDLMKEVTIGDELLQLSDSKSGKRMKTTYEEMMDKILRTQPGHASTEYCLRGMASIEKIVISTLGLSPIELMKRSSYQKALDETMSTKIVKVNLDTLKSKSIQERECLEDVELLSRFHRKQSTPLIARYPVLALLKNILSTRKFYDECRGLFDTYFESYEDYLKTMFGQETEPIIIIGHVGFSDSAVLARLYPRTRLLINKPVFM